MEIDKVSEQVDMAAPEEEAAAAPASEKVVALLTEDEYEEFSRTSPLKSSSMQQMVTLPDSPIAPIIDEDEFRDSVAKMSEFSSVLAGALTSLGRSMQTMEAAVRSTQGAVREVRGLVESHDTELDALGRKAAQVERGHNQLKKSTAVAISDTSKSSASSAALVAERLLRQQELERKRELEALKEGMEMSLENALATLKAKQLEPINPEEIRENLHDHLDDDSVHRQANATALDNFGIEELFQQVGDRVNDIEDCWNVQKAVNDGLNKAVEAGKADMSRLGGKLEALQTTVGELRGDLTFAVGQMRGLDKMQKRLDFQMDAIQRTIVNMQNRPRSSRPKTPLTRPKSSARAGIAVHQHDGDDEEEQHEQEEVAVAPPALAVIEEPAPKTLPLPLPDTKPELVKLDFAASVAQDADSEPVEGDDTHADAIRDLDGVPVVGYGGWDHSLDDELIARIEVLEQRAADAEAKAAATDTVASDATTGVRRLGMELQDVNEVLEALRNKAGGGDDAMGALGRGGGGGGSLKDNYSLSLALMKMKSLWQRIYEDVHFGIEQLEGNGMKSLYEDSFYVAICDFKKRLFGAMATLDAELGSSVDIAGAADRRISVSAAVSAHAPPASPATQPGHSKRVNYQAVLKTIHPLMYGIQLAALRLVAMDKLSKESRTRKEVTGGSVSPSRPATTSISPQFSGDGDDLDHGHPSSDAAGFMKILKGSTIGFDDFYCSDQSTSLGYHLSEAIAATTPLLDELIDKASLKSRIEELERAVADKAERKTVSNLEGSVRSKLGSKVDHSDFTVQMMKKASIAELQQFRDTIYKQLDDVRNTMATNMLNGVPVVGAVGGGKGDGRSVEWDEQSVLLMAKERQDTLQRFELLYKQFNDLMQYCEKFVPREEVEKAMHAVVVQVKTLKVNCVEMPVMKEALKKKADATDVKRLVETLEASIGELQGSTATAVHARCLMCDKVVTKVSTGRTSFLDEGRLSDSLGEGDQQKEELLMRGRKNTSPTSAIVPTNGTSRPASRSANAATTKIRMNQELAVVRCAVDLPPLGSNDRPRTTTSNFRSGDGRIVTNGGSGGGNTPSSGRGSSSKYEDRIRASAGGGMALSKSTSTLPNNHSTSAPIRPGSGTGTGTAGNNSARASRS